MKQKSIKKNAFFNTLRSLLTMLFPLITFPYASRILLPEGTGKVNFANQTVSIFVIIANLGINLYAIREAAKLRDDKEKLQKFCSQIFTLNFITTIFSYILFFTVIFAVPKYKDYHSLLFLAATEIIFSTIGINWFFQAIEEYTYITIQQIIFQILSLIFLFTFVKEPDDTLQYTCLAVIANTGPGIMNFFYHRKFIKLSFVKLKEITPHIKPILILSGATIATTIYTMLDTTMIGLLSNDRQVGLYTASIKVIRMTTAMLAAIYGVFLPRLSYVAEKNGVNEEYDLMVKKTINITKLFCIPTSIGIFVLAGPVINLLCGAEYNESIFLAKLLSPVLFFILSAGVITDTIFTPLRKDKENLIPVVIAAILNVIINLILIPSMGAKGAVIGTLAAESSVAIIKFILAQKYVRGKGFYSEVWKYFIAAAVMGICIYIVNIYITKSILQIIVGIALGSIIYYTVLKIIKCQFIKYVEKTIINILRKRKL